MNTSIIPYFSVLDDFKIKMRNYQLANEAEDVELVEEMHQSGINPPIPALIIEPNLLTPFMDIAEKQQKILHFMRRLRETGRLFDRGEKLPEELQFQTIAKEELTRLMGTDYLRQVFQKKQFKHVKVPIKFAKIRASDFLEINGWQIGDGFYQIASKDIIVYAQTISSVKRKLQRNEINEAIEAIAAANFTDINGGSNFVIAQDGLYFIDNDIKSFKGGIDWNHVFHAFKYFVEKKDVEFLCNKIKKVSSALFKSPDKKRREFMDSIWSERFLIKLVGSNKTGMNWLNKHQFFFDVDEII